MIHKDFWSKSRIGIIGGGSWGTVLAHLLSRNAHQVKIWMRDEQIVRSINSDHLNCSYFPDLKLKPNVVASNSIENFFSEDFQAVVWVLPSSICRTMARQFARRFRGDEILLHAVKGIEAGSMKRISEVLAEELPCRRIGVISGPNLAHEIARGEPSATLIASQFEEVCRAGRCLLSQEQFRTDEATDLVGVEWAGTLKNILAIAAGALDAMKLGWNARALLISQGLAEMVRFGVAMGGKESTFLSLAGIGDLLATCSSSLSRNYRVGHRLAQGDPLDRVIKELGSTAEGVLTAKSIHLHAETCKIPMPITHGVYQFLYEGVSVQKVLQDLMK